MSSIVERSEHDKKYDRQIRLWGPHGQYALETAHVCVLGSSALASEILKNLCLANVISVTVVDDVRTSHADLDNNFFVEKEDVEKGRMRADAVLALITEMNAEVKGTVIEADPNEIVNKLEFFMQFTIVIATQLFHEPTIKKLAEFLFAQNIPFIVSHSYGLLGSVRVVAREHVIVETKPDADTANLWVHPEQLIRFPELKQFIDTFAPQIESDQIEIQSHVPFAVLLGYFIQSFVKTHNVPSSYSEQELFKEFVKNKAINFGQELNFIEALKFAYKAYSKPKVSQDLLHLLQNPSEEKTPFWICIRALAVFREEFGMMPVTGVVPDMHADTKSYVALVKIFKAKHEEHVAKIKSLIPVSDAVLVSSDFIERFVKNVPYVACLRYRSIAQEFESPKLPEILEDEEDKPIIDGLTPQPKHSQWYLMLRILIAFYTAYKRVPTDVSDIALFADLGNKLLASIGVHTSLVADCIEELVRWKGAELHTISSIVGGVTAQEVTKLIVHQYMPINNTFLYDGIFCCSETWEL